MKHLKTYLCPNVTYDWDGHIHLFNHKKLLPNTELLQYSHCVGFMDLELDVENIDVISAYDNYIENSYNPENTILLATALNINDIKSIYNKYPEIIKGFGELKCYDTYKDLKVPYKKISFVRQVCKFSKEIGNLPVYLHWEINDHVDCKKLEKLLSDFPTVPIVLCHCGMNGINNDHACIQAQNLQRKYSNLWLDISYTALEHFNNNLIQLSIYDKDRLIFGSDVNNKLFGENHDTENEILNIVKMSHDIQTKFLIDNQRNILKLFKES